MNLSHTILRMLKKGCKLCYKRCIVKYLLHMLSLKYDLCFKKKYSPPMMVFQIVLYKVLLSPSYGTQKS